MEYFTRDENKVVTSRKIADLNLEVSTDKSWPALIEQLTNSRVESLLLHRVVQHV